MRSSLFSLAAALAIGANFVQTLPSPPNKIRQPSSVKVAQQSDVGPLHILYQNDLSVNVSTGAILVPKRVTSSGADNVCSNIGEQVFAYDASLQGGLPPDLLDQFNYLRYNARIGWGDAFWVQQGAGNIQAFMSGRDALRPAGNGEQLGVLCTHSAPAAVVSRANPYANSMADEFGADKRVVVKSGDYTLTGTRDRRSFRFLGIPFGDAPVGSKRFMHSTAYSGNKILDATNYRNSCIQAATQAGPMPLGEDCLNLNIFTTSLVGGDYKSLDPRKKLKPVLVAIYGGAFTSGRNSLHSYDGGNMASRSDIVVVTINYRLGALGFLASGKDLPGNAGISDQILALKWVRDHIAEFGGDPNQVTIGGESAGAQSVSALIASSAAKGLFRAGFMLSNPWVPWNPRNVATKYVAPAVATSLGCPTSGPALVECLQQISDPTVFVQGAAFTNATNTITGVLAQLDNASLFSASIEPFLPTPDGLLDDQIFYLAGNGTIPNKVPIMLGTLSGEGTLFIYQYLNTTLPNSSAALEQSLALLYPPEFARQLVSSGLFPLNASNDDSVRETVSNAFTYNFFTCPTQRIVDLAQQTSNFPKVYLYESQSGYPDTVGFPPKCTEEGTGVEVCHSDDIKSVFGTLNFEGLSVSQEYLDFVAYNVDAFSAFVSTMNPNPAEEMLKARGRSYTYTTKVTRYTPWQAYQTPLLSSGMNETQILSAPDGITHGDVPHRDQCDFFFNNKALNYQRINNAF